MMTLGSKVISSLKGKTLSTAESCTGGLIGAMLTAVPGVSRVYQGGIISYSNDIKHRLLEVPLELLQTHGAVSSPVAKAMAEGAKRRLGTDIAVSVTGLAGPDGDGFGNPVGTVFLGYADKYRSFAREYHFPGDREQVRLQAAQEAMKLILEFV